MEHESRGVHRDLQRIVASTLMVHEIFIASTVGSAVMVKIVDDWVTARQPSGVGHIGVTRRRNLIIPKISAVSGGF